MRRNSAQQYQQMLSHEFAVELSSSVGALAKLIALSVK